MSTWTLIWRNLGRNRLRTILTMLAVAFSIFLACMVLTLPSVRDAMLTRSADSLRLIVHHKAGLTYGWLPQAYVQRVRALPHVVSVSHWTWFGGVYTEPKNLFPNFAVDPGTLGEVWPDYKWDPAVLEAFQQRRDGALVGRRTLEKFGWKVGDEITLRDSGFGVNLTFKVVGEIPVDQRHVLSTVLVFPWPYFEEAMKPYGGWNLVGMLWVRVDQPEHLSTVIAAIDELFRNSETPTATETELSFFANFLGSFDDLILVIMAVGLLVVVAIILIAANTAAMSVRERVSEMAVLKTLGFQQRTIFILVLSEGLVIAGCGGVLGVSAAGFGLNAQSSSWSPFLGPLGLFTVPASVLVQGLLLAVMIGVGACVIPARGAARLNVAAALRQIT